MIKKLAKLIFIIYISFVAPCNAQYNYIITSFDYSSNTTTYGRINTLVKQPSYSPGISFFSQYGFDVSTLFYVLGNSDSLFENSTTELDLMVGYEWEPVNNLIIYPSYSHFFYSKNSNSFKSGFSDNIQLDIDYSVKFFNTGISGNYLLGNKNTGLLSFRNSILLEKEDFLFKNLYVAIQPGIDLTWGNQLYIRNSVSDFFKNNPDKIEAYIYYETRKSDFTRRLVNRLQNLYPDITQEEIARIIAAKNISADETFNLNAITLNLPAFFMIGSHFSLMVNLMYYKPINTPDYIEDNWKFFWSTGISYTFNL